MPRQRYPQALNLCTFLVLLFTAASTVDPQQRSRFSVKDDIEITQFGDVYFWIRGDLVLSPSGKKVVVHTVRTTLDDAKIHDELRIYSLATLRKFVNDGQTTAQIQPDWRIEQVGPDVGGDGPLVSNLRWADDENSVTFLLRVDSRHRILCTAELHSSVVRRLTAPVEDVLGYSFRSASHYAFTVASHEVRNKILQQLSTPFTVGTGRPFWDLMSPERTTDFIGNGELWAANGGPAKPVIDHATGKQVVLFESGSQNLSLSPDGRTLATVLAIGEIPRDWESIYAPPFPGDPYGIRAQKQDLDARTGYFYVGEYVLIDLLNGAVRARIPAPTALNAGWWEPGAAIPAWSDDGNWLLLPGAYIDVGATGPRQPCVAVTNARFEGSQCVRPLKRDLATGFEPGYARTDEVEFVRGASDEVLLKHFNGDGPSVAAYKRSTRGTWVLEPSENPAVGDPTFNVRVTATFKSPPVLVASDGATQKSRTVLDPNPQLKGLEMGQAERYDWEDRFGRTWQGILYKPVGFHEGTKYPLVLQNHGFSEDRFTPSGGFPSAFVAEELASAGIMVLQVRDCPGRGTALEGPCNVEGYEAAIEKLSRTGMIDPSRLGIIGFSRTVYYLLQTLTTSNLHFQAASITDGINIGYLDYLFTVGSTDIYRKEADRMIGAAPVGVGLLDWIKNAPLFNMEKVTTPLRVVATRSGSLIEMWEPYATLALMHKPVDLVILNTHEHVITDPRVRFAAQSGNVDWFRFWLQDFEDPDPGKAEQYARWRDLRRLDQSEK